MSSESPAQKQSETSPRRIIEAVVALVPVVLTLELLLSLLIQPTTHSPSTVAATWGIVLFASFVGWGTAANTLLSPKRRLDLGTRTVVGIGIYLFLGGLLGTASLISRSTILASVVGGLACFAVTEWRRRAEALRGWVRIAHAGWKAPFFAFAVLALLAAAGVQYLAAATPYSAPYNVNDDPIAYFSFAREMIGSGTLLEPFSLRRMASFGGQSYLQASMLFPPSVTVWQLHIVDRGLFLLVACALVVGILHEHPKAGRLAVLIALPVLLALPNTRINTSSQMTGAALFFGLFRLLSGRGRRNGFDAGRAVLIALVAMSICTLRQSYIPAVGVLLMFYYLARVVRFSSPGVQPVLRDAGMCVATMFVLLLPWMMLSYRSSGTFLFPLIKGYFNPDYSMLEGTATRIGQLQFLLANVFHDSPVNSFGLFVLAGITASDKRPGRPLPALVATTLLGGLGLIRGFPLSDPDNLGRYFYALEVAFILGVTTDVITRASWVGRGTIGTVLPACAALVAAGIFLMDTKETVGWNYKHWLDALESFHDSPRPVVADAEDAKYLAMQESIPPDAKLLVMLDQPYRLDFHRNSIMGIDLPGAVSPPPGIPLFAGGEAVADYLQKLHIRYVAFVSDAAAFELYSRSHWEKHSHDAVGTMWQRQSRFYLATFTDFDELAQTRSHLFDQGDLTVLDLATRIQWR